MGGTHNYLGCQVVGPDPVKDLKIAVATDCLASSVGVDGPAMSREATAPPGDSEDQHDGVQGK